jgi:hypothetical protein
VDGREEVVEVFSIFAIGKNEFSVIHSITGNVLGNNFASLQKFLNPKIPRHASVDFSATSSSPFRPAVSPAIFSNDRRSRPCGQSWKWTAGAFSVGRCD